MLVIKVKKGENIDSALKRYKRKSNRVGVNKELRERQEYTKPSVKRRKEKLKAKYVQKIKETEE